jgi:DNA mismatch repair protein MutS
VFFLICRVTPGTITEENLLEARENNYVASISQDKKMESFGIAWLDISTGDFFYTKTVASSLNSELSNFTPKEVLVSPDLKTHETISKQLKDYYQTTRPEPKRSSTKLADHFPELDTSTMSSLEISACTSLLLYIEETQTGKIPNLHSPQLFTTEKTLSIDPCTRSSLELVKTLSGEKSGSFLSVIDRTITPQGGRLIASRLNCPSINPIEINGRLDCVDFFKRMYPTFIDDVRGMLKKCKDIERSLQRLSLGRGSPRDLAAIGQTIAEVVKLKQFFAECEDQEFPSVLNGQIVKLKELKELEQILANALRDTLPTTILDGGFIKPGFSKELDEWIYMQDNSKRVMEDLQRKYQKSTGISTLRVDDNGIVGIYVTIPISQQTKMMEGNFKEFIHTQSTKNQIRYKTSEISDLQDKMSRAATEIRNIEIKIYGELVDRVLSSSEDIAYISRSISNIDLYSSFALLAKERNYTRPLMTEGLECEIVGGRHPVVEHFLAKNGIQFSHNDCTMGEDSNRILLILGPNMGGKSTFLRQNALIVILAQMGSFVPAESSRLGIVDKVFSRVGASDNLANDMSTFMIEMTETANILKKATNRSFVIMDEIGRGTSTLDGLAIAIAVLEHLNEFIKCRTLFATHYHELVDLKDRVSLVQSYKMDVKEIAGNLVFTYKVVPGETDRSYGVHVAQLAGIPNSVIVRAQEVLEKLERQKQKLEIYN